MTLLKTKMFNNHYINIVEKNKKVLQQNFFEIPLCPLKITKVFQELNVIKMKLQILIFQQQKVKI